MVRVLITGARSPVALDLARRFSADGHTVVLADSTPASISRFSDSCSRFRRYAKPAYEEDRFAEDIIRIIKEERIDLVVPTCEEIFYIARHRDMIKRHASVFCDSFKKLEMLHHKQRFIRLLESHGLHTPKTILIKSDRELQKVRSSGEKGVLKPVYSRFGGSVIYNHADRKRASFDPKNKYIFQEFIEGRKLCTYSISVDGKLMAHSCYPVGFKAGKASCIDFRPVDEDKLLSWVSTFVKRIRFTGQIGFDFIIRRGRVYAIECNPRATSGLHLFGKGDGIEQVMLGRKAARVYPSGGRKIMMVPMIVYSVPNISGEMGFRQWLRTMRDSKDIIYSEEDRMPFLMQWYVFIYYLAKSIMNGSSMTDETTRDIEWNGR